MLIKLISKIAVLEQFSNKSKHLNEVTPTISNNYHVQKHVEYRGKNKQREIFVFKKDD